MSTRREAIASFPNPFDGNPYLHLLYGHLASEGVPYVSSGHFGQSWLRQHRREVRFVHFHWLVEYYCDAARNPSFRKLLAFLLKLLLARALGYTTLWTFHNLYPHGQRRGLKAWLCRTLLVQSFDIVLVNFEGARRDLRSAFFRSRRVHCIPHGNYAPVYPSRPSPEGARRRLDIAPDHRVYLLFGGISRYKGAHHAIGVFRRMAQPGERLVIQGQCLDQAYQTELETLAAGDPRIRLVLSTENVPDADVPDLMTAADCLITPYEDIYSSGTLLLTATFGKALITPRRGVFADLAEDFLFMYDPDAAERGLAEAIHAFRRADGRRIAASAEAFSVRHDWNAIAARLAAVLAGQCQSGPAAREVAPERETNP